jgi:V/A-type H+/Na+-transporting ATPase subunit I
LLEPVAMVRLKAVILERDERAALQALGERGLLHLTRAEAGPDTAPLEPPRAGDGTLPWDGLLERLGRLRGLLGVRRVPGRASDESPEDVERGFRAVEDRAKVLFGRRDELLRRRGELSDLAAHLRSYVGLEIPLARIGSSSVVVLRIGTIPEGALEKLHGSAGKQALVLALPVRQGERRRPVVALGAEQDRSFLERALRDADFEEEALPGDGSGTLDDLAGRTASESERLAREEARLEEETRAFSEEVASAMAGTEARAEQERRLLEAGRCFPRTESTLLIQGWIPEAYLPSVEHIFRETVGQHYALETSAPAREEEEEVPVLLRSSPWLRPFEKLVAGFGLPRYRELSPAPFFAVSYLLMFGMMFGDVGHGTVLASVGLAALLAARWRDMGLLVMLCGFSSALFGSFYGSWFGLARFRSLTLWRDPLEGNPLDFMSLAIGLGVLLISLGLVLNILNRLRRRDVLGALMDRFGLSGLLFYWGALAFLLWQKQRGALLWVVPAILVFLAAAWVLEEPFQRALRGRGSHSPGPGGTRLTSALVEAFETLLVYLANTISFVRLAAYAMSHAALLLAISLMARAVARPSGAAGLSSWLVVVAGNLVAILLEGIVATVQALRLEYYEFFGKFFSGAGRPFEPFRLGPIGSGT